MGTVGYGDIGPNGNTELWVQNFVSLLGACLYSVLIASFGAHFRYSDSFGKNAAQVELNKINDYFEASSMPEATQVQILRNVNLLYRRQVYGLSENDVTRCLPLPLRIEISNHTKQLLLSSSSFLSSCDWFIRSRIALHLRYIVVNEGDDALRIGDLVDEVMFISKGRVRLLGYDHLTTQLHLPATPLRDLRNQNSIGASVRNYFVNRGTLSSVASMKQDTNRRDGLYGESSHATENIEMGRPLYGESGDHFGLARKGKSPHSVRALEDCELYVLDHTAILEVLDHVPRNKKQAFLDAFDESSLHGSIAASKLEIPRQFGNMEDEHATRSYFHKVDSADAIPNEDLLGGLRGPIANHAESDDDDETTSSRSEISSQSSKPWTPRH